MVNIRFVLHRIKPAIFCEIINKDDIIAKVINRGNKEMTPNININKF